MTLDIRHKLSAVPGLSFELRSNDLSARMYGAGVRTGF